MSELQSETTIRELRGDDSMESLTQLVRAAYAAQAARGLSYWGTHQTIEDTIQRFASGAGFVAELNGKYVGTIIVRQPQPHSPVELYREPNTCSISQFAVEPSFQGRGIGKALHDAAVAYALRHQRTTMALDTAAPAEDLISMYQAWGYSVVGQCDWRPDTNYLSVLMSRPLLVSSAARLVNPPAPGTTEDGVNREQD